MSAHLPLPTAESPRLAPVGDSAVLVEFGTVVDDAASEAVIELDRALAGADVRGLEQTVPAFVSLLVVFDPLVTDHDEVSAAIRSAISASAGEQHHAQRTHTVPICYHESLAPDLAEVAETAGLTPEAVVSAHLAGDYRVGMYGFAPGAAYLAGVPEVIRVPRKPSAVPGVAAGSVIIAGPQCLVLPISSRTGWWVIGRAPTLVLRADDQRPFEFDAGDRVVFERVDLAACERLERER